MAYKFIDNYSCASIIQLYDENANCLIPEQQFAGYHFWKMLGQTCIYYTRSCGLGLESEKEKTQNQPVSYWVKL